MCVCVYVRGRKRALQSPLFASRGGILAYSKWGNFDSPPSEAHALEKDSAGGDSRESWLPPPREAGAARDRIAGERAAQAGLAAPTSRGARAPSPSPACSLEGAWGRQGAAARLLLSLKGAHFRDARGGVLSFPDLRSASPGQGAGPSPQSPVPRVPFVQPAGTPALSPNCRLCCLPRRARSAEKSSSFAHPGCSCLLTLGALRR